MPKTTIKIPTVLEVTSTLAAVKKLHEIAASMIHDMSERIKNAAEQPPTEQVVSEQEISALLKFIESKGETCPAPSDLVGTKFIISFFTNGDGLTPSLTAQTYRNPLGSLDDDFEIIGDDRGICDTDLLAEASSDDDSGA